MFGHCAAQIDEPSTNNREGGGVGVGRVELVSAFWRVVSPAQRSGEAMVALEFVKRTRSTA